MPVAKSKRRQAIAPKRADADASLDVDLAEIDIKVDEMKAALEKGAEGTISEMRRIVETAILRLPSKIKGMRMREFMTDYGGDAALVLEKDRKQSRVARTVAKPVPGSRLDTIMRNKSALSRVAVGVGPVDVGGALSSAGSTGLVAGAPAAKQPRLHYAAGNGPVEDVGVVLLGLASSTSVVASSGAAGAAASGGVPLAGAASSSSAVSASGAPVLRKPLLSAPMLGLGGAGAGSSALFAPTPGRAPSAAPSIPMFNPLLPKTPAARKPRKGEVVMGYSANGSPLGAISLPAVNAGPAVGAAPAAAPLAAASSLTMSATAASAAVAPSAAIAHLAVPAPGTALPAGMAPETVAATIAALEQQLAMLRAAAPAMATQAVGTGHATAGVAAAGAGHAASSATATAGVPSAHFGSSRSVAKPTGSMSRLAAVTGSSSSSVLSASAVKQRPAAGERR